MKIHIIFSEMNFLPGYSFQKKNISIRSDHTNGFIGIPAISRMRKHEEDKQRSQNKKRINYKGNYMIDITQGPL